MDDYSQFRDEIAPTTVLSQIAAHVGRYHELTKRRDCVADELELLDDELKQLVERDIPTLLDTNGLTTITTADGLKVVVEEKIQASIKEGNRIAAHGWLEETGNGDIIKTKMIAEFGRNELEFAREAARKLEDQIDRSVSIAETVHPQTLSAVVRELLRDGEFVPQELLGVTRIRKAKIT